MIMQKSATRCFLCLLLVLTICLSAVPGAGAADSVDWGSVTARTVAAWTNDAVSDAEIRELLNSQELHPQKTGWYELDSLLGSLIAESGADDAYGQLRYMYEWMVKNVTYSWEGYSNTQASVASYNSVTGYNYLDWMNYDTGLTKSIPDDMANRT